MSTLEYTLTKSEAAAYGAVVLELFAHSQTVDALRLANDARIIAHELPRNVRQILIQFATEDKHDTMVLRGLPINLDAIPRTPASIEPHPLQSADYNDAIHILNAHLIGDAYTFSSIQHGNLINDVLPLQESADKPVSSGYSNDFGLHTEDAFSEYAGDFVGLMCLRNPDRIPTIISSIRDTKLSAEHKALLFEPVYHVHPNLAHNVEKSAGQEMAILFGDRCDPYMRLNANYNASNELVYKYKEAWAALVDELTTHARDVVLEPGECLYINNCLAAHGRRKYVPHLDGNDRWFRRLYITSCLRNSRARRASAESRLIRME